MRKFNFYYIVALVGAMVLSMSSCTKDLEDDIDALRKDVEANKSAITALDNAIKAGKLITAVTQKSDNSGWDITFSDNSKITVNNGAKGDKGDQGAQGGQGEQGLPGIAGPAGSTGAAGKDGYAPKVDIIDGYWCVKTSEAGAYEPIKDADGNKIAASKKIEFVGGVLKVDGIAVCTIPTIVLDESNGVAHVSVWNEDKKKFDTFDVLLDGALNGVNSMIRSLIMPIQNLGVSVVNGIAKTTFVDGPFANLVTKGEVLKTGGVLPVIVNPTNAVITKEQITIENAKGEVLPLTIKSVTKGFDGDFQTRAAVQNGLWTIELEAPSAEIANETYENYAIKVAKDNQEAVYSSYDYEIEVGDATTVSLSNTTFGRIIGQEIFFAGATETVLQGSNEKLYQVLKSDIYKSKISFKTQADKDKYEQYITITENSIKVADTNPAHHALNGKSVQFIYTVVDYNGQCKGYDVTTGKYTAANDVVVTITFNSTIVKSEYTLAPIAHTLTDVTTDRSKLTSLDPVFDQLGSAELVLWRENSRNYKVVISKDGATPQVLQNNEIVGVIVDRDGNTVTGGGSYASHIKFTFDETKAIAGDYTATFSYTDQRTTAQVFTVKVPLKVTNPTINLKAMRVAAHFTVNNAVIYGERIGNIGTTQAPKPVAQHQLDATFDLTTLYNNMTSNMLSFDFTPIQATFPVVNGNNVMTIVGTDMYKDYSVAVTYNYFGNPANSEVLDNIIVTSKSEVKEGSAAIAATKKLEVTNGDASTVKLNGIVEVKDVYAYVMAAFTNTSADPRIAAINVRVKATDPNAGLLEAPRLETDGDWTIQSKLNHATITADTKVTLEIIMTDLYGQETIKEVQVTVKK